MYRHKSTRIFSTSLLNLDHLMKIYENTVFLKNNSIDTRECISAERDGEAAEHTPTARPAKYF